MNKLIKRNFIIGDNWVYYKIYSGAKTSDSILAEIIKPLTEALLKEKIIDKWFFIRYSDPKHHIRLRFHYEDPHNISIIINRLQLYIEQYLIHDLIWKVQTDTYNRELERYGYKTMELSEDLFFYHSQMVVNFLNLTKGYEEVEEDVRWLFSLRAVDSFLENFGYSSNAKLNLLESLKVGFGREFGMARPLKKQLDKKYREKRIKIENFMVETVSNGEYAPILKLLEEKTKNIQNITERVLEYKKENELEIQLNFLLGSYIHMLMNRLFTSQNRKYEMVCYDFLYRYYKSIIAREKFNAKTL
ncbi:thiopeptide-type bacteriocin biosynthesis protein [Christiangramia sp. SM2212]|uniref:Thiopeptide-type bacteriocin biosynthesis protein n=1 Tax=Christiangramia sediminicola TaxID=3073267 RepID=A0ABU1ERW0_9FLAO|nr:thiopeptide-type bacteriocin biosynthesis protein [Christiangramia sp. SM2212]MDR5591111.1 thiopeptide-type bacteriocin biosynthesis protein [Christiangramia sp. SM2212]